MALTLMYITNDSNIAIIAQKHGVDRIWIDLETIGKEDRQKGLDTVLSRHTIADILKIKPVLKESEMLVRVNRWHEDSVHEINDVIDAGADIVMLPYWKTKEEVANFIKTVNGRCKTILLLETREAVNIIDEVLNIPGINEIHIGLNDLHLSYKMTFMFELLSDGTVEMLCKKIAEKGIPYGFGGIARIGGGAVPAEKIIQEHYRLGSTRAILSRTFCRSDECSDYEKIDKVFGENMRKLRTFEKSVSRFSKNELTSNKEDVRELVKMIVAEKKGEKI